MQTRRVLGILTAITLSILVATAPAAAAAGTTQWNHTRHTDDIIALEAGGGLAISTTSGTVHADDASSGTQQWTASFSSIQDTSKASNGRVVVADDDTLRVLDASDGTNTISYVTNNNGQLIATATDGTWAVGVAEDGSGGRIETQKIQDNPSYAVEIQSVPRDVAIDDRFIYTVVDNGTITARDKTLSNEWSTNATFQDTTSVASNGETVVVAGTDTNGNEVVAAYDRVDGTQLWTHSHHSSTVTDVAINEKHVASSDRGNNVITATVTDGSQVASHTKHTGDVEAVSMTDSLTISGDSSTANETIAVEQPARLTNPDPTDGEPDSPVTLTVDVTDPGTSDSHTITFYNTTSGNAIGTDSFSGSGTASVDWTHNTNTPSSWNATLEDGNGNLLDTTGELTFNAPGTLFIREELPPHHLITSNMNVTIRFFEPDDDTIYQREVDDGTLNLSGIPDKPYIVEVDPPDTSNYTSRTLYVLSVYDQSTVFLLDTSAVSVIESRFVLDDATGEFDPDSIIYLEKPIELNGDLRWRTIHADQFGAEGVTVMLEADRRYRVRLRNDKSTEQVVGPYRSDVNETVQVRPGAPTIELGQPTDGWYANATLDGQTLEYRYDDPENLTAEVNVTIYERGNKSNLLQPNETYTDLGSFVKQTSVSQAESEKEWVVEFEVTRDGETVEKTIYVRNGVDLVPGLNREWRLIAAVMMLLISAGAFSILNAGVGAVVVSIEGAVLYWTGWLQGASSAAAIVIAMFMAMLVHIYRTSGP